MIKAFHIVDGKLVEAPLENAPVSIYINPDEKERATLVNLVSLDEHTVNSALDPEELARIEFEETHLVTILKRPRRYNSQDNFLFRVSSIGLFLFSDKLIVVTPEEFLCEGKTFSRMQSVQDVFFKIIFHTITHFEEHLKVIRKISDELEMEINQALSNKDLLHMFKIEKSLVYYLDAINANNKVTEKLRANFAKTQMINEFLEDLVIEGNQCYQQADTYSQVLSSMMDAWASIINNNLNIRIKTLTILSLCIMMPTFVVSLFSMNVPLPIPQENTLVSFWIVFGIATFSVAVLSAWFYKKW